MVLFHKSNSAVSLCCDNSSCKGFPWESHSISRWRLPCLATNLLEWQAKQMELFLTLYKTGHSCSCVYEITQVWLNAIGCKSLPVNHAVHCNHSGWRLLFVLCCHSCTLLSLHYRYVYPHISPSIVSLEHPCIWWSPHFLNSHFRWIENSEKRENPPKYYCCTVRENK